MTRGRAIIMYKHISTRILQTGRMIALFEIYIIQYKISKIKFWYSHKRFCSTFFDHVPHRQWQKCIKKRCLRLKMIVWWTQSKNRIASCLHGGCFTVISSSSLGLEPEMGKGATKTPRRSVYSLWSMFLMENLAFRIISLITKSKIK